MWCVVCAVCGVWVWGGGGREGGREEGREGVKSHLTLCPTQVPGATAGAAKHVVPAAAAASAGAKPGTRPGGGAVGLPGTPCPPTKVKAALGRCAGEMLNIARCGLDSGSGAECPEAEYALQGCAGPCLSKLLFGLEVSHPTAGTT